MYYITGVAEDNSLIEITSCLTREQKVLTRAQFEKREDILGRLGKYYNCTELPDITELHERKQDFPNSIEHEEAGRYFLFIHINCVKTVQKPVYVLARRVEGVAAGSWKLVMLHEAGRGQTRAEDLAWKTENKAEALRKAFAINKRVKQDMYKVMPLTEALKKIKEDENGN